MKISELADKLGRYNPAPSLSSTHATIKTAKLVTRDQTKFEADVLYVGKASDLPKDCSQIQNAHFLCVENARIPAGYSENKTLSIMTLNKKTDLISLFNAIQDIFTVQQELAQSSKKLLDSLINGSNLQQIIETGFEILGNPIIILDNAYELVACTKNIETDDPLWHITLEKGKNPDDFINAIKSERIIERVYNSDFPIIAEAPFMKYRSIMAKVIVDKKVAAHIGVPEYIVPLKETDIELVSLLCNVLSAEIQRNRLFLNARRVMYEYFITDLLDGKMLNRQLIEEKMKQIDLKLNGRLFLLTVSIEEHEIQNTTISYAKDHLEAMIPGSKAVIHHNHIVLVINRPSDKPIPPKNLSELIEHLRRNKMYGGISRCFSDISDMQKYYRQSMRAIELGIRKNSGDVLFHYEDYAVYHFMDMRSNEEDLKDFCHPALFALMEYDRKNGTRFTHSLYVYLENARNNVVSARLLHIHRNSMNYRIEKIQEIMNADFNNKDLLFHLHLSFKILGFSEDYSSTPS